MKQYTKLLSELNASNDARPVTRGQLRQLEKQLDALFASLNIDVEFTKHFFDRLNDSRNGKQITVEELQKVFSSLYTKHGMKIGKYHGDIEELIRSVSTKINIPIVLQWNRNKHQIEMITKTIMRKKNFKSSTRELRVEHEGG